MRRLLSVFSWDNTNAGMAAPDHPRRVPLWIKVGLTLFVGVQTPFCLRQYGPTDFLWLCNLALLLTLAAACLESPLLASMAAVGVVPLQLFWAEEFIRGLLGFQVHAMMNYMFDPQIPRFTRGLSLFHGWLPFLQLFLLARLGYDRRALPAYTALAWSVMLVCCFFTPAPPAPATNPTLPVNINLVYGLDEAAPQTWMAPGVWLLLVMLGALVIIYLPTHVALKRLFKPAADRYRARRFPGGPARPSASAS